MNGHARVMVALTGIESTFLSENGYKFSLGPLKLGKSS
jgi:hypothetical protein